MKLQYKPLLPWPPGFFAPVRSRQRPQIQSWAVSRRHLWCWFSVPRRFRRLKKEGHKKEMFMTFQDVENGSCWLWSRLTHEEVFEFAFVDVMWKVADKELVAVRVADDPPALHIAGLRLASATCGWKQQLKNSEQRTFQKSCNHIIRHL